jgi:hypothetical protein
MTLLGRLRLQRVGLLTLRRLRAWRAGTVTLWWLRMWDIGTPPLGRLYMRRPGFLAVRWLRARRVRTATWWRLRVWGIRTIMLAWRRARRVRAIGAGVRLAGSIMIGRTLLGPTVWNTWVWGLAMRCRVPAPPVVAIPAVAVAVPGAIVVMIGPVVEEDEADHADPDLRAIGKHGYICPLVGVIDVPRIDPTAAGPCNDIAPAIVVQTAQHRDFESRRKYRDHRIFPRRAGTKVGVLGRISEPCLRHTGKRK